MTDLVERARFLASGQDDPHSATIDELCDRIEADAARLEKAREALDRLASAVERLPVEEMVHNGRHGPELLGYCMQVQGEWDDARKAANDAREALKELSQ